jgi:hypothetical protein
MSGKNHNKIPKTFITPVESKTPKAGAFPTDRYQPEFKAEQMDKDGPWGWNLFDPSQIQEVFQKIFDSQKLTWQDLRNNGSHFVDRGDLCSEFGAVAFADTAALAGQCIDGKLYIEPGTVHVAPNGIFLNVGGNFVPVSAVCKDKDGIYVLGYECVRMVWCPNPDCLLMYDADNQSSKCPHGWRVQYPES